MLYDELLNEGLSAAEAKKHFYLVDKRGLLFEDTIGLTPAQKPFARKCMEFDNAAELTDLTTIVKTIHSTVMIGASKQAGAFTEEIVKEMAAHTARPIIFPISNPTKLLEAKASDLIKWTEGRALVATGIPSASVHYKGVTYQIGQANNALVYLGAGFGAIVTKSKIINEKMLFAAAYALGELIDPQQAIIIDRSFNRFYSKSSTGGHSKCY